MALAVAEEEAHVVAGLVVDHGIDHGDALVAVDVGDIPLQTWPTHCPPR